MQDRGVAAGIGLAGLAIAAGIAFGGLKLAESRAPLRAVTVKGLAERVVEADAATWRVAFRGVGDSREAAIGEAAWARDAVLTLGAGGGLAAEDMTVEPFSLAIERMFLQGEGGVQVERLRFIAAGAVRMRTAEAGRIEALTARTGELLDQGVLLGAGDYDGPARPAYAFTGLNGIKPELIAEATRAARASAAQFAEDSGSAVGRIIDANQGVVQIFAADGDYEERSERRKLIRVVSTVRYELTD